jgi:hypothetical protein
MYSLIFLLSYIITKQLINAGIVIITKATVKVAFVIYKP